MVLKLVTANLWHGEVGAVLKAWVIVGSLSTVLNWSAALTPYSIYNNMTYQ
jgi:hypothetical protein